MRSSEVRRFFTWVLSAALMLTLTAEVAAHEKEDEKLPPPALKMRIIAPSAQGPWLLRLDNEAEEPLRIAADVRLLRFEVRVPSKERLVHAHGWTRRSTVCDGTKDFGLGDHFPVNRELVLEPGQSYVEQFDPRLICFGKDADLLVPGALVKPSMGWPPQKVWGNKMQAAPWVADSAQAHRHYRPVRRIEAPSMVLSHSPPVVYGPGDAGTGTAAAEATTTKDGAKEPAEDAKKQDAEREAPAKGSGEADSATGDDTRHGPRSAEEASRHQPGPPPPPLPPSPPEDQLAARMTLTASRFADSVRPTDIEVQVQAHNTGERPVFAALRDRMLSFRVMGPDGVVMCKRQSAGHQVPRDLFSTIHHGKHVHMLVMLAEVCPPGTFNRQGLYRVTPTLHADADGRQYGLSALTGKVTTRMPGVPSGQHHEADDFTLVRVKRGRVDFYKTPPTALPTRVLAP